MPFFLQRLSELFEKNIGYEEVLSRKFPFLRDLGIIPNPLTQGFSVLCSNQLNYLNKKRTKFSAYSVYLFIGSPWYRYCLPKEKQDLSIYENLRCSTNCSAPGKACLVWWRLLLNNTTRLSQSVLPVLSLENSLGHPFD